MRELTYKLKFTERVSELLRSSEDVTVVQPAIQEIYDNLKQETPLAKDVEVTLVELSSLAGYFYQLDPTSPSAIMIEHVGYKSFLWQERYEWCLDDSYFNIDDIVGNLSDAELFRMFPENVRELHKLLKMQYWEFKPELFPLYDNRGPNDMREILSFDKNYVLAGLTLENIEVIRRQDWNRLCDNEERWFEE